MEIKSISPASLSLSPTLSARITLKIYDFKRRKCEWDYEPSSATIDLKSEDDFKCGNINKVRSERKREFVVLFSLNLYEYANERHSKQQSLVSQKLYERAG